VRVSGGEPVVREAERDEEIARCHRVMHQLRPHVGADGFVERVRRLQAGGYRLAYVEAGGEVVALAGFRVGESLPDGVHLHVDDLVTDAGARSAGHGERLMRWLEDAARREGCACLTLESGVQRFAAHRFYLRQRMEIRAHHFVRFLDDA
jgi:GNAT superfamily N-acetyltransferase